MKNIQELQKNDFAKMKWNSLVSPTENGVIALDRISPLKEIVKHHEKKNKAKVVAKKVAGAVDVIKKKDIENILINWTKDDECIRVKVLGTIVTLQGTVHSISQKNEVSRIVFNMPGVWMLENKLVVEYKYYQID